MDTNKEAQRDRLEEILSKVVYGKQVHPRLNLLVSVVECRRAGVRTLRYGQEAIRHKRPPSRAARGSLPFIAFAS